MSEEESEAPLSEHLEELRSALIRLLFALCAGFGVALYYSQAIIAFISKTLPAAPLALFSPAEGFLAVFKLSFWSGVLLASPLLFFAILRFIKPALKEGEKKILIPFALLSLLFVGLGFLLCLNFTLPLASAFFFQFNEGLGVNLWGFGAYLDFVLLLLAAHGIAFEMGAFLLLLIHMNVISRDQLKQKRRHALVGSLILGALLTPPDVLTQLAIAIPLYIFYEIAILYGKFTSTSR